MVNAKKAFRVGFIKGRRHGANKVANTTPRQAYSKGFRAGKRVANKNRVQRDEYYYRMGKGSHN